MISDSRRIAIGSVGVISALGIGRQALCRSLAAGRGGIGKVSLFETTELRCHTAAEIRDFDPHDYLRGKPLRGMSRSAHLVCSATSLALSEAEQRFPLPDAKRVALVAGTSHGNVNSVVRFDRESYYEGPKFVDAMLFPNTVINSPAGFVSIFFGLTGPNTTVSEGITSSLRAFDYAARLLQRGAADQVIAGGLEELSRWVYLGMHNSGRLAGSRAGDAEEAAPFDRRRTGVVLGEGVAMLQLLAPAAVERAGCAPHAWMTGYGESFVTGRLGEPDACDTGAARRAMVVAMRDALHAAGVRPGQVDAVWASAGGDRTLDALEAEALGEVFGERAGELPVVAVKGALGECFGASGALQVSGALLTLVEGIVPATHGFVETDCSPALGGLRSEPRRIEARHVLINGFSGSGNNASLVLSRA
ncbi:MAG: beta-ketoacyl-[acyl-carrier-protein] synthase family protein [Candidatus Krumholzibacteriia bacterium]